jgi:hypothetical protein
MLQHMYNMETSCVIYVKVGTLTQGEESKISHWTCNKMGIVQITVQHDLTVYISFK